MEERKQFDMREKGKRQLSFFPRREIAYVQELGLGFFFSREIRRGSQVREKLGDKNGVNM